MSTTKTDSSYTDSSSFSSTEVKRPSKVKQFVNNFGGLLMILVLTVLVCLWFMHFDGSFDQPDVVTNFLNIGSDYDPTN